MLPELPTTLQLVNSDLGHLPDYSLPTKNQLTQPSDSDVGIAVQDSIKMVSQTHSYSFTCMELRLQQPS
jgi:hypothetical protein